MTGLIDDLRAAYRSLSNAPVFTLTAITILALGVGGSTGVFSLLHSVVLRPLPYTEPERLAVLWTWEERRDLPDGTSYLNWADWGERTRSFDELALYERPAFTATTLTGRGEPRRIERGIVTPSFFDVLGVAPALGRNFTKAEEMAGASLALVSDAFWRQELGAYSGVLGDTLMLDGRDFEIIGVMPPGFRYPQSNTVVWTLHSESSGWPQAEIGRAYDALVVLGRLVEGATFETAQEEFNGIAGQLAAEYPDTNTNMGVRVIPLLDEVTGATLPRALWFLFGAMVFVLLIAAANVAHLGLARGATRRREMAIRAAIGAGGVRLARQQAVESAFIATVAGLIGGVVSVSVLRALVALAPADIPRLDEVSVDPWVLGAAWLASVLLGLGFSAIPAWTAARSDAAEALREGGRGTETSGRRRMRGGLVVAEVALAMILVSGAALLLQSLALASNEFPGIMTEGSVVARVHVPRDSYDAAGLSTFYSTLLARLETAPGVESAGVIGALMSYRIPDVAITVEGLAPEETPRVAATNESVYPGFFGAAGATIMAGRDHTLADLEGDALFRRVVINETAARTFWPDSSAIGMRFKWGPVDNPDRSWNEVVGVVRDLRRSGLDVNPVADFYVAAFSHGAEVVVRGDPGQTEQTVDALRRAVAALDARVPVSNVRVASEAFGESLARRRFQSTLSASFAGLAIVLSAAGLFGLLHEAVTQRRREIGVRLALGASPPQLLRAVMLRAAGLTSLGVLIGVAGATALADLLSGFLYGVGSTDLVTLLGAAGLLILVGLVASLTPGLRATHVDPAETLTAE
jgi:predicted permease